jgi:preprotein translocase SecE subunit
MTDDPKRDEEDDGLPAELEHTSAGADEARAVTEGGDGADVDDFDLEQQAISAEADLDDDGDIDDDDRALATTRGRKTTAPPKGGPRAIQFLRASWAELQRVQWPNGPQVGQATAVVIGFVIIAGAYLGVADWAAQLFVDLILG